MSKREKIVFSPHVGRPIADIAEDYFADCVEDNESDDRKGTSPPVKPS